MIDNKSTFQNAGDIIIVDINSDCTQTGKRTMILKYAQTACDRYLIKFIRCA